MFKESAFAKKEQEELKEGVKKNEPLPDIEPTETIDRFKETIIGQEDAIASFAQLKEVLESEIRPERGPLHVEWLSGPSGVGKTEMVKKLIEMFIKDHANDFADASGNSDVSANSRLVRIDGGSCQEAHSIAKVIGTAPGYVGYEAEPILGLDNVMKHSIRYIDKGGQERKVCFVLIDEAEKANESLYRTLLPALDEGVMTLGNGTKVDLRDCAFFFTSNLGHEEVRRSQGQADKRTPEEIYYNAYKEHFSSSPEFIGRVKKMTIFRELNREEIGQIVYLRSYDIEKSFRKNNVNLTLELSDRVVEWIVKNGYSQETGARSIQNLINEKIAAKLTLYNNKYDLNGVTLTVDLAEGENGAGELKFYPPEGGLKPKPKKPPIAPGKKPPRPKDEPKPEKKKPTAPEAKPETALNALNITEEMLSKNVRQSITEEKLKIISERVKELSKKFNKKDVIERLADTENNHDNPPTKINNAEDLIRYLDQLRDNNI